MESKKIIWGKDNYSIYRDGRVYNSITKFFLQHRINHYGYYVVKLSNGRKNSTYQAVHRLLAIAFIPNPENKPTVDHINRNKTDNRLENLRWATKYEQVHNRNPTKTGFKKPNAPTGVTGERCIKIRKNRASKYLVNIKIKKISKCFKTLEEAIKFRDEKM